MLCSLPTSPGDLAQQRLSTHHRKMIADGRNARCHLETGKGGDGDRARRQVYKRFFLLGATPRKQAQQTNVFGPAA